MWGKRDTDAALALEIEQTKLDLLAAVDRLNGIVQRLNAEVEQQQEGPTSG